MSMQILEKLFGSAARVKIIKLFLFHPEECLEKTDIAKKTKVQASALTKELNNLESIGLIRKKSFFKEVEMKTGPKKKRVNGYILDQSFIFLTNLRALLINTEPFQHKDVVKKISRAGKIKMIVVSGIFIQADDEKVDILIVGDDLKERSLSNVITDLESEIGKELKYVVLNTADFKYRLGICDKLVRDIFDYPHQVVIDRIGLSN
jgi:hypothetical protein